MERVQRVILPLLVFLALLSPSASVAGQQSSLERDLDEAKVLYRDGRLDEAVAALRGVVAQLNKLRDQQSRKTQLSEAHLYLGLSYFAVRDESAALENFRQVAVLDPSRRLDPEVYSPRVMSLFDQARADVDAGRIADPAGVPPTTRDEPNPGAPKETGDSVSLQQGTKVRLQLGGAGRSVTGNLLASNDKSFTLVNAENQNLSFPRDTVTKVEVIRGRKGHWLMGMVIGAALGAAGGAVETPGCGGNDGDCYTRGENIEYATIGFGLVGALVGALYRTDQWVEVSLDRVATPVTRTADRRMTVSFVWRY